jgi:hypothetical protein
VSGYNDGTVRVWSDWDSKAATSRVLGSHVCASSGWERIRAGEASDSGSRDKAVCGESKTYHLNF